MLRGLVNGTAWTLATGAAVTLSWWGVHSVLSGTVHDPPRTVPVESDSGTPRTGEPVSSSTRRPEPSPSRTPRPAAPPERSGAGGPAAPRKPSAPPSSPAASVAGSGSVRVFESRGGRVVFDLGVSFASLVSATPAAGWSMRVWHEPTWIRVEFGTGAVRQTVLCTWDGHPPQVRIIDD